MSLSILEQAIIHASDLQADDRFGASISLSADGSTMAVGANGEDGGIGSLYSFAGAAYVFTRSGVTWTQQAIIHASDLQTNDQFGGQFGGSISLSADGSTMAVGANGEDGGAGKPYAGAAYVYTIPPSVITVPTTTTADATIGDGSSNVTLTNNTVVSNGAKLTLSMSSLNSLKGSGKTITVESGSAIKIGNSRLKTVKSGTTYKLKARP